MHPELTTTCRTNYYLRTILLVLVVAFLPNLYGRLREEQRASLSVNNTRNIWSMLAL